MLEEVRNVLIDYKNIKNSIIEYTIDNYKTLKDYLNSSRFSDIENKAFLFSKDSIESQTKFRQIFYNMISEFFGFLNYRRIILIEELLDTLENEKEIGYKNKTVLKEIVKEVIDSYISLLNQFFLENIPYDSEEYIGYNVLLKESTYEIKDLVAINKKYLDDDN